MKWPIVLAIASVVSLAVGGCGSQSAQEKLEIAEDDSAIARAESDLAFYCLDGSVDAFTAGEGVDALIRVARKNPDHKYDGKTMRQLLADQASDMDGCDGELARRLDRGRESLP